ncbi:B12-binding domain-containing radical SAM protein [Streptomyces marianii]|uniref:Radical SAM protein n=1 Tax=Streptomyces marianii TaxID=1817406 RepID=A0A5R9DRV3_9ACTN|nr:radical SAM protein [Streptomyces marianii]TLQ39337.1 radical SAM protein [Streptomyces marianii]
MSLLDQEIDAIRGRETTVLGDPYPTTHGANDLRMVFLFPYGHAYSLMCNGPMALYDLINRDTTLPAYAERAIQYDSLIRDGNRLRTRAGAPYRTIESAAPVRDADVIGVSVTNAGDLHSVFRLLDLAGIPRRTADRVPGVHPLVIGGQGGLANPEVLADYLDVVALGEAEKSLPQLLRTVHAHRQTDPETPLLEQLARIPGLYVPSLYTCDLVDGGGVSAVRPTSLTVPDRVSAQWLELADLHDAHFAYPVTDGTAAGIIPLVGCRHTCSFCTLGVPPFRQAPLEKMLAYIDRLEELSVPLIIISAPTFTQYRHRAEILQRIRAYRDRAAARGVKVSTIIGSVRADEMTADYLRDVNELGDFGHLFTELSLTQARGIVTIAPEFAAADLVAMYGKTMPPERVDQAIDRCRHSSDVINTIMLYFIIGAPGEREEDRLAIADRAREIRDRLGRPDGSVIVKLHQFMPEPGTPAQRLPMTDPALLDGYVTQITDRLRDLVGQETFAEHYRVQYGETNRLYLEAVCLRGDRRVGRVLEDLYDSGADLTCLDREVLLKALDDHGLDFERHLRRIDDPVLPWHTVNEVDPADEQRLLRAIEQRTTTR